jgi:hypothetical protein
MERILIQNSPLFWTVPERLNIQGSSLPQPVEHDPITEQSRIKRPRSKGDDPTYRNTYHQNDEYLLFIMVPQLFSDSHLMALMHPPLRVLEKRQPLYILLSCIWVRYILLYSYNLTSPLTDLSVRIPTGTKLSSHSPEWKGASPHATGQGSHLIKVRSPNYILF